MKKILAKIRKADQDYNLINDGDKIAIGISGGKDSTLLLYALNLYKKVCINSLNKKFDIVGIHIDLNFGEEDFSFLRSFFKENDIEFIEEKSKIADILKIHTKKEKIQCSLCSKLKKGAVVNIAKKHGCNKLAFGHHGDDAIETLFLNMIYGGKIATFDPIMHLENSNITFIRPFIYLYENEIAKKIKELQIPRLKSGCPNDGNTKRQEVKELLHKIYHQFDSSKDNFLLSLHNMDKINLFDIKDFQINKYLKENEK